MLLKNVILSLVLVLAAAIVTAPSVLRAGDEVTVVKFNQPVEVPGLVLPAGTYLFKATGSVVQIWDADQTTLYKTMMTVPAYRRDAEEKPEFEFEERAAGAPKAIDAWYHDAGSIGVEFVYPK